MYPIYNQRYKLIYRAYMKKSIGSIFHDMKVEFNIVLNYLAQFLFCCNYDNYLLIFFNIIEEILILVRQNFKLDIYTENIINYIYNI